MSNAHLQLLRLHRSHDRSLFNSGSAPLDNYFRHQVTQDVHRRVTTCYGALTRKQRIAGFYTLASAALLLSELPADKAKKLPRYPTVPAVRTGRLAVDAKDESAAAFYRYHGLIAFPGQPSTLFLPLATARRAGLDRA